MQLGLLLRRQLFKNRVEARQILTSSSDEEVNQVCLRLVVPLSHERPLSLPVCHQLSLRGAQAQIQDVVDILPAIVFGFLIGELLGRSGGGKGVGVSGCGKQFLNEDFDDLERGWDDGVLIGV